MNIRIFQHVPFEGPGTIAPILQARGHQVETSHLYRGDTPHINPSDSALIVMGGPMGVGDIQKYPWLSAEKLAIDKALNSNLAVLGICLGAQLMAETLGATVAPMGYREIGWHRIVRHPAIERGAYASVFPETFTPFHWHGDQFSLPAGTHPIGYSNACACQGFVREDHQLGLQFHLEFDLAALQRIVCAAGDEIDDSAFVQKPSAFMTNHKGLQDSLASMEKLLEIWLGRAAAKHR